MAKKDSQDRFVLEPGDFFQNDPHLILVHEMETPWSGWHQDYELLLILQGKLHVQWHSGSNTLCAGDIAFFRGNLLHRMIPLGTPCAIALNRFPTDIAGQFPDAGGLRSICGKVSSPVSEQLRPLVVQMCIAKENMRPGSQFLQAGLLYEVLGWLEQQGPKESAAGRPANALARTQRLIDLILEQQQMVWTTESAAQALEISTPTLQRDLHRITGMSFSRFLRTIRVDQAKRQLIYERIPLEQVAADCGFGSIATFYRCFKAVTGVHPMDYRRKRAPQGLHTYDASPIERDTAIELLTGLC